MKKNIKFIYFDVGNVLLDYMAGWDKIVNLKKLPKKSLLSAYSNHSKELNSGKMKFNDVFDMVLNKQNIDINPKFDALWEISKNYIPINETHILVTNIQNDYSLGILSNATCKMIDYSKTHGAIPNIKWSVIIDSSKVGYVKPDPKIYKHATEKSGVKSDEILFIDDLKENIDAAREYGWNVIQFDFLNPEKSVEEIKKYWLNINE